MKNKHLLLAAVLLPALLSGCGLEIFQDWQNSQGEAMPGAGAIAGKDYITGLEPSTNARDYFSTVSDDKPIETVSRNDSKESKTGVRFVNDGGIVIPPGVTISFENKGYCLDPNLPAPKAGDEYQFVPMKRLIPTELQGTYKRLIAQESAGSSDVKMNMQRLVWAMRTAGTESALANSLTSQQKQILDRCSDYAGQFESFNESAKSSNKLRKELNKLADSLITIRLGDVTYSASDLLNPEAGLQKISDHVDHLIELGDALPVENTGFNYGELEPGIYTDIQGTGYMQFHVRIANNTSKDYTFYPSDYVGQVGSPSKSSGLNLYAAECIGKQRMTCSNQNKTDVVDKKEPQKEDECDICNGFTPFNELDKLYNTYMNNYIQAERNRRMAKVLYFVDNAFLGIPGFFSSDQELQEFVSEKALETVMEDTPLGLPLKAVNYYNKMKPLEDAVKFWKNKLYNVTWTCPKCKKVHRLELDMHAKALIPNFD